MFEVFLNGWVLYTGHPLFLMDMVFFDWSGVFYDCRSIFEMSLLRKVKNPLSGIELHITYQGGDYCQITYRPSNEEPNQGSFS
jgi:hypothetical protein